MFLVAYSQIGFRNPVFEILDECMFQAADYEIHSHHTEDDKSNEIFCRRGNTDDSLP